VYNPGGELRTFAATLAAATTQPYELVLVNNGLPSPVADEIAAGGARMLRHPQGNVGYGRAANLGAANAAESVKWLVVANPDIEWSPGSLDLLIEAAKADPQAGAIGPRVLNPDGSIYPSARALPSLSTGIGHAVLHHMWPSNPWSRRYRQDKTALTATDVAGVGWLSGACLLLRPAAFAEAQGFDERYFMFFEDVDLGDRLGRLGWRNLYVPQAQVTHTQGASWKAAPARMIRAHHVSARRYLFDRLNRRWQAPLRWALGAGLAIREQVAVTIAVIRTRRAG